MSGHHRNPRCSSKQPASTLRAPQYRRESTRAPIRRFRAGRNDTREKSRPAQPALGIGQPTGRAELPRGSIRSNAVRSARSQHRRTRRGHSTATDRDEESRARIPLLFALDVIHGFRTIFPVPLPRKQLESCCGRTLRADCRREAAARRNHWTFAPMGTSHAIPLGSHRRRLRRRPIPRRGDGRRARPRFQGRASAIQQPSPRQLSTSPRTALPRAGVITTSRMCPSARCASLSAAISGGRVRRRGNADGGVQRD